VRGLNNYSFRTEKSMQTKLDSGNAIAFLDRGVAHFRTGDLAGAISSFVGVASLKENRALQFDPDNADTYGYRCVARHRVGDLSGAIADCQHAANLYLAQGNDREYEYAIEILTKLQDLSIPAA
jgi:Flp pilus assembly protein TadD